MHVTADRDGTLDRLHVHLGLQDLFRLIAEGFYFVFWDGLVVV